jgi:hypothetical protein
MGSELRGNAVGKPPHAVSRRARAGGRQAPVPGPFSPGASRRGTGRRPHHRPWRGAHILTVPGPLLSRKNCSLPAWESLHAFFVDPTVHSLGRHTWKRLTSVELGDTSLPNARLAAQSTHFLREPACRAQAASPGPRDGRALETRSRPSKYACLKNDTCIDFY